MRPAIEQTNTVYSVNTRASATTKKLTDQRGNQLNYPERQHKPPIAEIKHSELGLWEVFSVNGCFFLLLVKV